MIWAEPKSASQEEKVEQYNFNTRPMPISQKQPSANAYFDDVESSDDDLTIQTVTGNQDLIKRGRLDQFIIPQSLGCGTLDLLPKLSVDATKYNAELFYICKFFLGLNSFLILHL